VPIRPGTGLAADRSEPRDDTTSRAASSASKAKAVSTRCARTNAKPVRSTKLTRRVPAARQRPERRLVNRRVDGDDIDDGEDRLESTLDRAPAEAA